MFLYVYDLSLQYPEAVSHHFKGFLNVLKEEISQK